MQSAQSIIQLGLKLLKEGKLEANELESYREAFSILDIDVSAPLKLAGLKSVFSDFSTTSDSVAKYFKPVPLEKPFVINYPVDVEPSCDFSGVKPPNCDESHALTALEKYGTFVSVASVDSIGSVVHSQTPLYDLFKTAAAIHDCLKTGEGDEKFLLVGCDFSGIQDTVYTITSKGALKTLRARSFMLELLTEHIVTEILEAVDSDRHAIIYSGGGGFSLLLSNSLATIEKIMKYRKSINDWALDEFVGRLFIAIDVLPFAKQKFVDEGCFQELRQTQSDNLDRLKRTKFSDQLALLFDPKMPEQLTVRTECQITRRDDLDDSQMRDMHSGDRMDKVNKNEEGHVWVSESCFRQFHIGDQLIGAKSIVRTEKVLMEKHFDDKAYFKFPDINWSEKSRIESKGYVYYYIVKTECSDQNVWRLNDWSGQRTILFANYVRKCSDLSPYAQNKELELANEGREEKVQLKDIQTNTASFAGLAASSTGADLIGALRMDVDDMGDKFSKVKTLAELASKSRILNLFFKIYLTQICNANLCAHFSPLDILEKNYTKKNEYGENKGRNVSVIYAGGDDLFIIGAWDDTTELAFDIQKCFHQFTGGDFKSRKNEIWATISGGLTLHHPKFPLYQMARISGEAEHAAKNDKDFKKDDVKKNRIGLFHDDAKEQRKLKMQNPERYMLSMTWDLGNTFLLPLMKTYYDCGKLKEQDGRQVMEIDKFSYQTIEKWFAVIEKYLESHKLYLPTMARVMKQVEENPKMDRAVFIRLFGLLYTNEESKKNWISHLHIALNWISYLRRTK